MYADSYFALGSTHDVCQDYALAGVADDRVIDGRVVDDRPIGIAADGCSSSPHTDFGARFLAFGAREALRRSARGAFASGAVLPLACTLAGGMLPMRCLDATLGVVYGDAVPARIHAWLSGDGIIVARLRDGSGYPVTRVEFSGNAPGYLSYQLSSARFQELADGPGATRRVDELLLDPSFAELEAMWGDEQLSEQDPRSFWLYRGYEASKYDLVMVLTDGAQSFQRRVGGALEPVPLHDVLREVLAFKGMKGRFVARRLKRFLGRYCAEHGWSHADDFAVAAVYAGG
jgi:hypothetical protein